MFILKKSQSYGKAKKKSHLIQQHEGIYNYYFLSKKSSVDYSLILV